MWASEVSGRVCHWELNCRLQRTCYSTPRPKDNVIRLDCRSLGERTAVCEGCGNEFSDSLSYCPSCGRAKPMVLAAQNWRCGICGKTNGPDLTVMWELV